MIKVQYAPRQADEVLLAQLSMRLDGYTDSQIAASLGRSKNTVIKSRQNIRDDDLKYAGEPAAEVLRWYR